MNTDERRSTSKSLRERNRLRKFYGFIGMEQTGSAENTKSPGPSPKKRAGSQYVVCINNEDYPASLELRKIYSLISDKRASKSGLLRVIDESGEDYLYPAGCFVAIRLPHAVAKAVQLAS